MAGSDYSFCEGYAMWFRYLDRTDCVVGGLLVLMVVIAVVLPVVLVVGVMTGCIQS